MTNNLLAASRALVDALASGDLDAAARAMELRAGVLGEGASQEAIALGDEAMSLLEELKRQAVIESGQLQRAGMLLGS